MTSVMMTLSEVAEQKKDDPSNGVHRKLKEARGRPSTKKEFAAGAPCQRSASGPGTHGVQCQSAAPRTDFATVIVARSAGPGCP